MHIEQFHPTIKEGIVIAEKSYLFAHTNVFIDKDEPFGRSKNFGSLYYASIRALRFCCGKCIWTPCVELFSMFLKSFYCLFYCQVSGVVAGLLLLVHLKIAPA